jgi:hypothetical protein
MIVRAWRKYRARKSIVGICFDFFFLVVVIFLLVPQLRFLLHIGMVRLTLCQPTSVETTFFVNNFERITFRTVDDVDTTITFDVRRPVLYNFGSLGSAQSCAELRSLNKLAKRYFGQLDVFFITDDDPWTVKSYFDKYDYVIKPLFYVDVEEFLYEHDMLSELCSSVPASLLVDDKGRVIIKKFGAAKWVGSRVEAIVEENLRHSNP